MSVKQESDSTAASRAYAEKYENMDPETLRAIYKGLKSSRKNHLSMVHEALKWDNSIFT